MLDQGSFFLGERVPMFSGFFSEGDVRHEAQA